VEDKGAGGLAYRSFQLLIEHAPLCGYNDCEIRSCLNGWDSMKKPMEWLIAGVALTAIAGCCSKQCPKTPNYICAQGVDKQAVMNASQDVLEDMHFTIEKADTDAGYISTRPLAGAQFFEFWRSDTVGCYNFTEANLYSVTRTAEINITPKDGTFCVECKVDTRRLSMPSREISSATELPGLFTRSNSGLQKLQLSKVQKKKAVWIDMGPDPALQARILEKIGKQISDLEF
jgi:hypothetical protein